MEDTNLHCAHREAGRGCGGILTGLRKPAVWWRGPAAPSDDAPCGVVIRLTVHCRIVLGQPTYDRVVAVGRDDGAFFAAQIREGMAVPDGPNAAPDQVAEYADPAIGGAEMLQAVDGDGSLRDLRLIIAGMPLTFLIGSRGDLGAT
jgi:hypothetical protein